MIKCCPFLQIADCPLYIIGHSPKIELLKFGCVDDLAKPCRVERGVWKYEAAEMRLRIALPIRENDGEHRLQ